MQANYKRLWIDALLSGDYKQGRKSLRPTVDTYCPLGLLCEVVSRNDWAEGYGQGFYYHRDESGFPADSVLAEAGLTRAEAVKLSDLNDIRKLSFKALANFIEENL